MEFTRPTATFHRTRGAVCPVSSRPPKKSNRRVNDRGSGTVPSPSGIAPTARLSSLRAAVLEPARQRPVKNDGCKSDTAAARSTPCGRAHAFQSKPGSFDVNSRSVSTCGALAASLRLWMGRADAALARYSDREDSLRVACGGVAASEAEDGRQVGEVLRADRDELRRVAQVVVACRQQRPALCDLHDQPGYIGDVGDDGRCDGPPVPRNPR